MNKELRHLMTHGKLCQRVATDAGAIRYEYADGTTTERVDQSVPLGTYKEGARWHHQQLEKSFYFAKVREGFATSECLGRVGPKNDGRWDWIRHAGRFQGGWTAGQGVAMTQDEAISQVEEGWS
jgi:hypothetical protein